MFGLLKRSDGHRAAALTELKSLYPNLRVTRKDEEVEVLFTVTGQVHVLKIWLDTNFPNVPPGIRIATPSGPMLSHRWIDPVKHTVNCPALNIWNKSSSLRDLVQLIIKEFVDAGQSTSLTNLNIPVASSTGNPFVTLNSNDVRPPDYFTAIHGPSYQQNQQPPSYEQSIKSKSSSYNDLPNQAHDQQPMQPLHHPSHALNHSLSYPSVINMNNFSVTPDSPMALLPDVPTSFPELRDRSEYELEGFLNDPEAFSSLVRNIPTVENMTKFRDELRESNLKQASENLQMEDSSSLHNEVTELQKLLRSLVDEYQKKYATAAAKFTFDKPTILNEIKQKCDLLDATSEDISSQFLQGDLTLAVFLRDYLEKRKEYHSLSTKHMILARN